MKKLFRIFAQKLMKLQAVTVSVNYADFLEITVLENKTLFDKWVIVTDKSDKATKEVCDKHNLTCIQTDAFYENGAKFNKWAGLNKGLEQVDKDAWCLILDGDIVLHYLTRRTFEKLNLNPTFIYGVDRLDCIGFDSWDKYKLSNGILKENWLLHTAGLKMGARLVHHFGMEGENGRFEGYRPLGFFQLMHRSAFDKHPQDSDSADHCDLVFAREWPRERRMLIPEIFAIHLISEDSRKGQNWRGRKSKPFRLAHESNEILGNSKKKSKTINIDKLLTIFSIFKRTLRNFFLKKCREIGIIFLFILFLLKRIFHCKKKHYY